MVLTYFLGGSVVAVVRPITDIWYTLIPLQSFSRVFVMPKVKSLIKIEQKADVLKGTPMQI